MLTLLWMIFDGYSIRAIFKRLQKIVKLTCEIGTLIDIGIVDNDNYIGSYNGSASEPDYSYYNEGSVNVSIQNKNEVIYVLHDFRGENQPLLMEGDKVTIYGVFRGVDDYELAYSGGNIKAPEIVILYVDFYN